MSTYANAQESARVAAKEEERLMSELINGIARRSPVLITLFAFHMFAVYAVNSTTLRVTKICGDGILLFVIFDIIWSMLENIFLIFTGNINRLSIYDVLFLTSVHVILLIFGASIVAPAMGNASCTAALSSVSFTSTPMLGIIGYIFIGLDATLVASGICYFILAVYK